MEARAVSVNVGRIKELNETGSSSVGGQPNSTKVDGTDRDGCEKYVISMAWPPAYKIESLTQKVYRVYRKAVINVCKVSIYSNLIVGICNNPAVSRYGNLFLVIATCFC